MDESMTKRSTFSSRLGFVMAAASSAIGLGNLWRFPYLAAQYGGGIFILVYIILALTFGFALMVTEIGIGRKTKLSPIKAYGKIDKRFDFMGIFAFLIPALITPYYSLIGGWVTKYAVEYIRSIGNKTIVKGLADDSYFGGFISETWDPLIYFIIFFIITTVVVIFGVEKGIERASKVLMPVLIVISLLISVYVIFMPGSGSGIRYYLLPDFEKFSLKTVCAAMGQLFYSMSLAMGIMITYGSYMKDDEDLVKSVNQIEFFDSLIAVMAGFMIIPAIFVYSGEEGLKASGAGLMFVSLPKIFAQMPMGGIIGALFFALVFFAALTSSISLLEALVSMLIDNFKIKRLPACIGVCLYTVLMGIPSSLGYGVWADVKILGMDILSFFDFITNSIMMPILACITTVLIGWIIGTDYIVDEITKNGEKFGREKIYRFVTKFIAPILLIVILVFYTLAALGVISY